MPHSDRERLQAIKTFPSLVKYLRDDLDWPIESENFDDLSFDWEAEELGIDLKTSAKIEYIKQLRPLTTDQPWGIFFAKFEPKRLPVVALRRILGALALKKRTSTKKSEQPAWRKNDLLFISAYGEDDNRHITFAHFSENPGSSDLPVLKVLGWDGSDTPLHIDHIHQELTDKLRWPDNTENVETWRESWSSAFTLRHREVITTSKQLAICLADLARDIRLRANSVLAVETENGPMRKLMAAFKEALIHDLDEDDFADMYAQTIAYGLLTARISRPAGLVADNLTDMVPITNPFLKELMETFLHIGGRRKGKKKSKGLDFDELGVNEVVEMLRNANMEAVIRDFGDRNPAEDPVILFYELFLKEYDAKKRMQRGVFYTPKPVVSFIVRSVHELLQTEFGLKDGLADTTTWGEMIERNPDLKLPLKREKNPLAEEDEPEEYIDPATPFVQILDPATGTATFLVEVIDIIHKTMTAKWRKAGKTDLYDIPKLWNDYVPKHLLPRLHGYELLMAPYAIAHMKIGLKLAETGYRFGTEERTRIYLTNALEPWVRNPKFPEFEALAHEAAAVNEIKRHRRFTVVIGNPPYSMKPYNKNPFIDTLMDSYKQGLELEKERRIGIIDDDYVRFMRYARWQLSLSGHVRLYGFITKNNFLEMAVSRGIRYELISGGAKARIINLHGELKKDSAKRLLEDENVFDIRTPVAISVVANSPRYAKDFADVTYIDFLGSRASKYERLASISSTDPDWLTIHPTHLLFSLYPSAPNATEYSGFIPINNIFSLIGSGVKTHKDNLVTDTNKESLEIRMRGFLDKKLSDEEIKKQFAVEDTNNWTVRASRRGNSFQSEVIHKYHFKPFDIRYIYYADRIVARTGRKIVGKMVSNNWGLCLKRRNKKQGYHDAFVSNWLVDINMLEGQTYVCPLFLANDDNSTLDLKLEHKHLQTNVKDSFKKLLCELLGVEPQPKEIFSYIYGIVHSPEYRSKYGEDLRKDFPRIPLPKDIELFHDLIRLGGELTALHLLESPKLAHPITEFIGGRHPEVEKISWSRNTVWIDKAKTRGFRGVPEEVWNFHIGGYQVCQKWLKDRQAKGGKNPRPGRVLTDEDIDHYQKIVVALSETIRIMAEIDEVIESHGGWPDAFVTEKQEDDKDA